MSGVIHDPDYGVTISEDDLWEDPEAAEYCSEVCYHDWLCDELEEEMDPDNCVDSDCYRECIRNFYRDP